jgi:hypothetical protein
MPEWWTYSLSDFLMFAPRTYWRLVALYNAEVWPAHFGALAGGLGVLVLSHRRPASAQRVVAVLLALAWGWVAWGWLHLRFTAINWPADYAAAAFAIEAAALIAIAARRDGFGASARTSLAGLAVVGFAVIGYPFVALQTERSVVTAEVFGLLPDPTVIATLGVLVSAQGTLRAVLLPIPLAWCVASGAMLWAIDEAGWWLPPLAALLALLVPLAADRRFHPGRRDTSQRSDSR